MSVPNPAAAFEQRYRINGRFGEEWPVAVHGRVLKYIWRGSVAAIHSEPDPPGANMVCALRTAASRFSAFAANGRFQFSPVTGQGREHAFGVHASRRSLRISCLTAGQDFIPDARESVRHWPQWPTSGPLRQFTWAAAFRPKLPLARPRTKVWCHLLTGRSREKPVVRLL